MIEYPQLQQCDGRLYLWQKPLNTFLHKKKQEKKRERKHGLF